MKRTLPDGSVLVATVSIDDGYLSVTGEHYTETRRNGESSILNDQGERRYLSACGCLHDEISEQFPLLRRAIAYHLCKCDGTPMHYVANSLYWAKEGNLEYFRATAVWPDAPAEILDWEPEKIKVTLKDRLPALKVEFDTIVKDLGL